MTMTAPHYAHEHTTSVSSDVKLEKLDPVTVSSQSVNYGILSDL